MALVDEMIDKGSEFSLRGTDDELDMRSAVEASLGYEDLGAAEQDMRIRYVAKHRGRSADTMPCSTRALLGRTALQWHGAAYRPLAHLQIIQDYSSRVRARHRPHRLAA